MIDPFLKHWFTQIFWLLLCWTFLFAFFKKCVVPWFLKVQGDRESWHRKKELSIQKTRQMTESLQQELYDKKHKAERDAFKKISAERKNMMEHVQKISAELDKQSVAYKQKSESTYITFTEKEEKALQDHDWKDAISGFIKELE